MTEKADRPEFIRHYSEILEPRMRDDVRSERAAFGSKLGLTFARDGRVQKKFISQ